MQNANKVVKGKCTLAMKQKYGLTHGRPYPQSPIPHICSNDQTLCLIFRRKYPRYPKNISNILDIHYTLFSISTIPNYTPRPSTNLLFSSGMFFQSAQKHPKISENIQNIQNLYSTLFSIFTIQCLLPNSFFQGVFSLYLLKQPSPIIMNSMNSIVYCRNFGYSGCFRIFFGYF